jgi:hypothetical protein
MSSQRRSPVEVADPIPDQAAAGETAVRSKLELVQHCLLADLIQLEYRAAAGSASTARKIPTPLCGSLEVASLVAY